MSEDDDGEFASGPGDVMKRRFGWTAENWTPPILRPEAVPENIRDLVPFARRWGVTCDVTRHDVAEKASEADLAELSRVLQGRHDDIVDFLYSGELLSPTTEQAAFSAMLVFELEELRGPGVPGYLPWAIRRYEQEASLERRAELIKAYDFASDLPMAKYLAAYLERARELLKGAR